MAPDTASPVNFDALSPVAKEVAQAMARVASDIALVIDRDGVIRSVAEGASPLPAECSRWVGRRWVDTVSTDTRRKIELLLDEVGSAAISQRREVNHPTVDGDSVPMAWTVAGRSSVRVLMMAGSWTARSQRTFTSCWKRPRLIRLESM